MRIDPDDPLQVQDMALLIDEEFRLQPLIHKDRPDWYPTDDLDVNIAWADFAIYGTDMFAMDVIELILDAGLPMPKELVPWVKKTIENWRSKAGNKQRYNSFVTDFKWRITIQMVYMCWLKGMTVEQAIDLFGNGNYAKGLGIKAKNLHTEYKRSKYREMKKRFLTERQVELAFFKKNNEVDLLEEFAATWPRVLKLQGMSGVEK